MCNFVTFVTLGEKLKKNEKKFGKNLEKVECLTYICIEFRKRHEDVTVMFEVRT